MEPNLSSSKNWLEPAVLKAAVKIYQTYCQIRKSPPKPPKGVAIDCKTYRGQLLFTEQPLLLPGEIFILVDQLQP